MESPRFLGSRFHFWLVTPGLLCGIGGGIGIAKNSFEIGDIGTGMLTGYIAFLCALGMFGMLSKRYEFLCRRIWVGHITLAYVAYFSFIYFVEGQSLMPSGRESEPNAFKVLMGLIVIGLPCAYFAVTGRSIFSEIRTIRDKIRKG